MCNIKPEYTLPKQVSIVDIFSKTIQLTKTLKNSSFKIKYFLFKFDMNY